MKTAPFFGWRVVAGAFVIAVFGWGLGFYGPPIYLHAVREGRGWSVALVSCAVTVHYLCGALVVANLPALYRRFGFPAVTRTGTVLLALGLVGWAVAEAPWQLFAATLLTGAGWVTLGAAAINAIVSPWFVRLRPKALATAYNGASVGGVLFSPLWVVLIGEIGFARAALLIGSLAVVVVWWLTARIVSVRPEDLGQLADGVQPPVPTGAGIAPSPPGPALTGAALWSDRKFRTLAAGMALGLFAQIGLLAHLFSLMVPAMGASGAGVVAGLATAAAIAGRMAFGWCMPEGADRRLWAALSYGLQIAGIAVLAVSGASEPPLIVLGVLLFGLGIGNATSLPPLIAQVEFRKEEAARVVPLIVALSQACYAFAPAVFGLLREVAQPGAWPLLLAAAAVKACAILALLSGRAPRDGPG